MAKNQFKFKLKITGFELEVEGSKEDVAAITSSVTNQIRGLTSPQILDEPNEVEDAEVTEISSSTESRAPKKKAIRRKSVTTSTQAKSVEAIDLKKDPIKYSSPSMKWTMQQKALWLLYVVKNESAIDELTITQIVITFNKHFQQSKTIHRANVARDLGKVTMGKSALVQENSTKSPATWYLTSAGDTYVQDLIKGEKS
jgi:hypothetical protein